MTTETLEIALAVSILCAGTAILVKGGKIKKLTAKVDEAEENNSKALGLIGEEAHRAAEASRV